MNRWTRKRKAHGRKNAKIGTRKFGRAHPVLDALGLPEDVTGNSVRVIIMGSSRALIENHLGVAEITKEEIRLTTRGGIMAVRGEHLRLEDVRGGALSVAGKIHTVELPGVKAEGGSRL